MLSVSLCEETMAPGLPAQANGLHQQTDAALIQLCLAGDEPAWSVLLERYSGLIYSIGLKARLSPEDVADVFQSVCLILLEGLEKLKDVSKLSSWITTITLRQCLRVKRQQRLLWADLEHIEETLTNLPDDSPLPDEEIQQLEQERLIRQAISMLDEPCQRLLTFLYYEDKGVWSYDAIACEMGLSVASIGAKRRRCLKKLKGILDELGFSHTNIEF